MSSTLYQMFTNPIYNFCWCSVIEIACQFPLQYSNIVNVLSILEGEEQWIGRTYCIYNVGLGLDWSIFKLAQELGKLRG